MPDHFPILLLLARPGAGKSEIIHYLKSIPDGERMASYHLGPFEELDDFPMLWTWFEEDDLLTRMGKDRLHTDSEGYFRWPHLWNLLIERISLDYRKLLRDDPVFHLRKSLIVEFSRGSEHGGYASAFQHISREMAEQMAILYVNVSWEESLRKNRKRFNPSKPDSILEHSLPDAKLERLYREVDWPAVTRGNPTHVDIQGVSVPYVVMENEDDVTTRGGDDLGTRLASSLQSLWEIRCLKG
jgi:hypothetical protein